MSVYVGVNGIARKVSKIYVGDSNGIAREVKAGYVGVNGVARKVHSSATKGNITIQIGYGNMRCTITSNDPISYYVDSNCMYTINLNPNSATSGTATKKWFDRFFASTNRDNPIATTVSLLGNTASTGYINVTNTTNTAPFQFTANVTYNVELQNAYSMPVGTNSTTVSYYIKYDGSTITATPTNVFNTPLSVSNGYAQTYDVYANSNFNWSFAWL